MWTLVLLLLPAVLSAPVNLPQTITCPDNNIFVYVNGSAHDRTPYIFVELNATDLHDCIHKCFGNQFCYSLKYESTAVEPCSLYYFAAYNCSGQKLVHANEVQYPGGAITIDCLRCPANGDFVTAPPFDSFTEQMIVAKDSAGNPILSKPLEKVVTDNIESKLAPGNVVAVSTTEEPKEESTASGAVKENESTTSASTTPAIMTAESRKMVEERKCSGSLKYRIQTDIDRETVQLLLNETTVESGNECAQLCYDLKCGFAYYKPSDKTCRFTSNTEDVVDGSSCDEASEHSVPEEEVVVTCISCDIEASPAKNIPQKGEASPPRIDFSIDASPSPPTIVLPASTLYPACIINFQLDEEADTASFKHYEVKKVKSVNDCARICFRGGCSTAVFSPQSLECRLGSELKESCSNAPSTIRYLKQADVKIQCFRCSSPKHFAKELETQQSGATTPPVISHQEDQQAVSQSVDEAPPTTPPTTTEKGPTGVSMPGQEPIEQKLNATDEQATFGKNCIIKFQARPLSKRPAELNAPFELDLNVDSVELCATRCYQDGCSGARYDPSNGTCSLAYNDKHFCAKEPTVLHYKADEVTWIHCVNCYSDKGPSASSKEPTTKAPIAIVPVILPGGSTTEKSETATSGPEGGTQPSSKEGPEETTPKTATSATEATEAASNEGPEEAKSTSAPELIPKGEGTTQKAGASTQKPGAARDFLRGCLIKFQARPIEDRPSHLKAEFEISLTVDSVELCATRCYQDGCTGAKYDPEAKSCALSYNDKQFCSNAPVQLHYNAQNITWIHCVNCYSIKDSDRVELAEQQEAAPEHVSVETGERLPSGVEGSTTEIPEIEPKQVLENRTRTGSTPHFQKKCAVKFQARPYSKRPAESKAPFEIDVPVDSIELCATRCFQDGCTGAKYDPTSKSCSLSYADKHFCDENDEVHLHYDAKEPTWIHCVNCYSVKPRPTGAGPEEQTTTGPTAESTAAPSEATTESESSESGGTAVPVLPGATTAESVGSSEGATTSGEESSTAQPSSKSTEAPGEPQTTQNISALSDDELKNLLDKGCVVSFQIVELEERPPEFTASFDPSFETETAEICAYRCYQDGCTGAKYDPNTRECALSYGDRARCSNAKLVQVARPQQSVFMHCFSCVPHRMLPNIGGPAGPFSESIDNAPSTEEKPATAATAQTTEAGESSTPSSEAGSSTPLGTTGTGATTSPTAEAAVTEASGEEATTELSATTAHEEASGEEPLLKTTAVEEVSTTSAGSESTATPQGPTVTVAIFVPVGGATTAAPASSEGTTEQPSSTIPHEEASGEEPSEKSTTPRIEASIDEVASTESTAVSLTPGNIATEETIAPKVAVKLEGSVTEPSLGETTEGKSSTTLSPEEASGEEPAVQNTTPGEQAGSGGSITASSSDHTTIESASTLLAVSELSTTATPGGEFTPATTSPAVEGFVTEASGEEATTAKSESTTTHEEPSGEEPLDKNAVPGVQASIDEATIIQVTAESTPIGSSTTASTSKTATPAKGINLVPIVFVPAGSSTTPSTEQTTTEGFSTITPKEASGEEPLDKSALPTVQASHDESTSEPAVGIPESASTTTSSSIGESPATTLEVESFVTEASGEQPTTEKSKTTAGPSVEASGEEPIDKTAVGEMVSGSEQTTTASAAHTPEGSSTAAAGTSSEATPQGITIVPVAFIPVKATTEASTEQSTTEKESTTSLPEEASGEKPLDKNAIPAVQASLDETTTSVTVESTPETAPTTASGPSSSESTTATTSTPAVAFVTEASGEETKAETSTVALPPIIPVVSSTATSTVEGSGEQPTSSTNAGLGEEISVPTGATTGHGIISNTPGVESSGEEPLDKNAIPKVEASVDETPSTTAKSEEDGSTTVAPGTGETSTVAIPPIIPVVSSTTTSTVESSGEEPTSTNAGLGEEISVPTDKTTSGHTTSLTTPGEEASGEEPLDKNAVPKVGANVDETPSTTARSEEKGSTTVAPGTGAETSTVAIPPIIPVVSSTTTSTVESSGEEPTSSTNAGLGEKISGPAEVTTGHTTLSTTPGDEASGEEPLDKNAVPKVEASVDETPSTTAKSEEEGLTTVAPGTGTATTTRVVVTVAPIVVIPVSLSGTTTASSRTTVGEGLSTTSSEETSGEEPLSKSSEATAVSGEVTTKSAISTTANVGSMPSASPVPGMEGGASTTASSPVEGSGLEAGGDHTTMEAVGISITTPLTIEETVASKVSLSETTTASARDQTASEGTTPTSAPEEASGEEPLDKNALPKVAASIDEAPTTAEHTPGTVSPTLGTATSPQPSSPEGEEATTSAAVESTAPVVSSEQTTKLPTSSSPEEASGEEPLDKSAVPSIQASHDETSSTTASTSETSTSPAELSSTGHSTEETQLTAVSVVVDSTVTEPRLSTTAKTTPSPEEASGEEPLDKNAAPEVQASMDETTSVSGVTSPNSGTGSTSAPGTKVIVPIILVPGGSKTSTSTEPTTGEQATTPSEEASGEQPLDKNALPPKEGEEATITTESSAGTAVTTSGTGGDEVPTTSLPAQGSVTSGEGSTTKSGESITTAPLESSGEELDKSTVVTQITRVLEVTSTPSLESSGEGPIVGNILPKVESSIDEGTTKVLSTDEPGKTSTEPSTGGETEHSGEEPTTRQIPSDQSTTAGEHETTSEGPTAETSTVSIPPIIPIVGTSVSPSTSHLEDSRPSTVAIPPMIPVTGATENESTTPTVEASGEEPAVSRTPSAEENENESTSATPTTSSDRKASTESAGSAHPSTPSEPLEFITTSPGEEPRKESDDSMSRVPTGAAEEHTTSTPTEEGSAETPLDSNAVPKVEASHDGKASTESPSSAHPSTPSEPLVFITDSPDKKGSTESPSTGHASTPSEPLEFLTDSPDGKTRTESASSAHSSTPSEPLEFITTSPGEEPRKESDESTITRVPTGAAEEHTTSTPTEEGSGETPLDSNAVPKVEASHDGKASTESPSSAHPSTPSEPLEFLTDSPERKTSIESANTAHASTPSEPLEFLTDSPNGKASIESTSSAHPSTPSEPLEFITESPDEKANKVPEVQASMDEAAHSTPTAEATTGVPTTTLVFLAPGGAVTEKSGTTTPAIEASGEDPHHIPKIEPSIDEITSSTASSTLGSHEASTGPSTAVSEEDHSTVGAFILGSDRTRVTTVSSPESSTTGQPGEESTLTNEVSTSPSIEGSGESVEGSTPKVDFSIDESKPIVRVIPGVIVSIERITEASPGNTTKPEATSTTASDHTTGEENEVSSSTSEPQTTASSVTEASGEEPLGSTNLPKVESNLDGGSTDVPTTEAGKISEEASSTSSATSSPGPEAEASTIALSPVIPVIGVSGRTSTPSGMEEGRSSTVEIAPLIVATPVTGKGETSTAAMPPIIPVESTTTSAEETSGEEPTSSTNAELGEEISVPAERTTSHTTSSAVPGEEASGEEPLDKNAVPKVEASVDETTSTTAKSEEEGSTTVVSGTRAETSTVAIPPIIPVVSSTTTSAEEVPTSTNAGLGDEISVPTGAQPTSSPESASTTAEEGSGEGPVESNNVPKVQASLDDGTGSVNSPDKAATSVPLGHPHLLFGPSTTSASVSAHLNVHATKPTESSTPLSESNAEEPSERQNVPKAEISPEGSSTVVPSTDAEQAGVSTTAASSSDHSTQEAATTLLAISEQTTTATSTHPGASVTEQTGEETTSQTERTTTSSGKGSGEEEVTSAAPKLDSSTDETRSPVPGLIVSVQRTTEVPEGTGSVPSSHTSSSSTPSTPSEGSEQTTVEKTYESTTVIPIEAKEQPALEGQPERGASTPSSESSKTTSHPPGSAPDEGILVPSTSPQSFVTEASDEATTPARAEGTTSSSVEEKGEDRELGKSPIVESSIDDGKTTEPSEESSRTTSETQSSEPSSTTPTTTETLSGVHVVPLLVVSPKEKSDERHTTPETAETAHPSTPSEPLEFITESPGGKTRAESGSTGHASTPSEPLEFLTDRPDGKTSTESASSAHPSTPSEPLEFITTSPGEEPRKESDDSMSTRVPTGAAEEHTTSTPTEEGSGETPLDSNAVPKVEASHDGKASTESPSSAHPSTPSEPLVFITDSPDKKGSTESPSTGHASTPSEPLEFLTDSPDGKTRTESASSAHSSTPSEPLEFITTSPGEEPRKESDDSSSTRPTATVSSANQEDSTGAAGEHTTSSPTEEGSGERLLDSNAVPKVEASHDGKASTESASIGHVSTPSEPLVFITDSPDRTGSTESPSTGHASTPSEPLEFLTDSPDGKTRTESASSAHSSTPSEPLEFITTSPGEEPRKESDDSTSTRQTTTASSDQEEIFVPTGAAGEHTTSSPAGEGSGETPIESNVVPKVGASHDVIASTESASTEHVSTPSEPLVFITDSPDRKDSTESAKAAHASTPSEPLEFLTDSPDKKASTESSSTAHASTPSEPLVFITDSPDKELHSTTKTSDVEGPVPSHPLDSSFVHDVTPSTSGDDLINRTLLEPHKSGLPVNVGFVPGSEPDTMTESEEEEEESENTELTTQPDYEDAVAASKKPESTSAASSTTAEVSTTTEPPVQAVQDLIDTLAAGGLNAVLGPPRQTQLVESVNSKLGDLKKYLHKPLEQKQDCASRRLRFVASELTDLSTRFSADAAVYSLQHCARMCYETGCSLAAFTRFPRPVCLMRYGNSTAACDSGAARTSSWSFASVQQVVKLECIECEKNSEFITQKEQIDITNLKNGFSTDDLNTVVPVHEGLSTKCDGRLEFHTVPAGSLPPLNVTNDIPARTPADCAKKCFDAKGCSTAGFIASPAKNISHGVCLLTSDSNVCVNNADYVPQYASLNPIVISCIKCTPCTYNIRSVTPDRVLPDFNHAESVSSIGECARACYARRCTIAQYSSQQKSCMMTSEPMESQCAREVAVVTEGVLPVTLECVRCSS